MSAWPLIAGMGSAAVAAGALAVPAARRMIFGSVEHDWLAHELELDRIEPDGMTVRAKPRIGHRMMPWENATGSVIRVYRLIGETYDTKPEGQQSSLHEGRAACLHALASLGVVVRLFGVKRRRAVIHPASWPSSTLSEIGDAEANLYRNAYDLRWYLIVTADLGDPTGFQVQVRAANLIAVRPSTYGVDTNLNVYTKAGTVYPFYLRAESFNSVHVPDIVVHLLGREKPKEIKGVEEDPVTQDKGGRQGKDSDKPNDPAAGAVHNLTHPAPAAGDFVRAVPFDPSTLHGWKDYDLWGGGEDAERLKPEVVYRDDFFTYLQYGAAFDQVELPVAYVVRDGIDELVNSRVQGNTFIIESVAPLISLKNGKSFLCIRYLGEDA